MQTRENNEGKKKNNFDGKEEVVAAVFPCEIAPSIQQEIGETIPQLVIERAVVPTNHVTCSSYIFMKFRTAMLLRIVKVHQI